MKKLITILISILVMSLSAIAQEKPNVTITVCDTAGVAVPNALIKIKPTKGTKLPKEMKNGTTTDAKGMVTLPIGYGDILIVSGKKLSDRQIVVGVSEKITDDKLNIILLPSLDEEIEVGFGTQKKSLSTTAVTQRDEQDLQGDKQIDMYTYLQRALPGVQINRMGTSYSFQIRGMGSISGNDTALVLIDGTQGDIGTLTPQQIKSITVLKDAASTAVYGGRAAFGAIIVKTKSGNSK